MFTPRDSITKKNIIIVGDFGSGKTSLLHRFIKKEFTKIFSNANLDFYSYEMKHKDDTLQVFLWDSLGHERFQSMTDSFYRKADGAVLVFDITDDQNMPVIMKWIKTIYDNCKENIPIIIVGNKKDICSNHEKKIKTVIDSIPKSKNIVKVTTVSAKNGDNVEELFRKIIISTYENNPLGIESKNKENTVTIEETNSSFCCILL